MKGLSAAPTLLVVVVSLAGCGEVGEAPVFEVRDSAGVQIVESHRPAWGESSGWHIGSEPAFRLGVLEGESAFQFDGVMGVARLGDGTLVVADGGSQEVRFFDAAGNPTALAGGTGEGPGEFTGLSGLGAVPGGFVWAYDFSLRRITWLNGSGEVEGLVSLGSQPPVLNRGATQVAEASEAGLRRDPVAFVRFDAEGALVDTLGLFPGRELFLTNEDGRGVMSAPLFGRNSVGAVWEDGVVVGSQESFELVKYAPEGEPMRIVRIPAWDLTLGPGDLEAYIQSRIEGVPPDRQPGTRRELEAMPAPATKPAYGEILSDEVGNLWVGEWTSYPLTPERWTVLDRSGRWLGEVVMPGRFFPFVIGEDWVLGVEWDDLDVEYVVLYPLSKDAMDG